MQPIVVTTGPLIAGNTSLIAGAQHPNTGNLVLTSNPVTLDTARTVLITTTDNEGNVTFTLQGTDWAGSPISEQIVGPNNTTGASVLSYKTITAVLNSANITANVTVGTTGNASGPWIRLDSWASTPITKAAVVSSAGANYTVQVSMDDPNALVNAVSPANMTWFNDSDTNFVAKAANAFGSSAFIPNWMRVFLNSGNGTVTLTVSQASSVPY